MSRITDVSDARRILKLPPDATEIDDQAYKALRRQAHPDRHAHNPSAASAAEERFKELEEARELLRQYVQDQAEQRAEEEAWRAERLAMQRARAMSRPQTSPPPPPRPRPQTDPIAPRVSPTSINWSVTSHGQPTQVRLRVWPGVPGTPISVSCGRGLCSVYRYFVKPGLDYEDYYCSPDPSILTRADGKYSDTVTVTIGSQHTLRIPVILDIARATQSPSSPSVASRPYVSPQTSAVANPMSFAKACGLFMNAIFYVIGVAIAGFLWTGFWSGLFTSWQNPIIYIGWIGGAIAIAVDLKNRSKEP